MNVVDNLNRPIRSVEDWAAIPPHNRRPAERDLARSWLDGDAPAALRTLLDRDERTAGLVLGSGQAKARKAIRQPLPWRYHDLLLRGVVAAGPIVIAMRAERRSLDRIDNWLGRDRETLLDDLKGAPVGDDVHAASDVAATLAAATPGAIAAVITQSFATDGSRSSLSGPFHVAAERWADVPLWLGRLAAA